MVINCIKGLLDNRWTIRPYIAEAFGLNGTKTLGREAQ